MTTPAQSPVASPALERPEQLERLLAPSRVAVVGASPQPRWGLKTIQNLETIGYEGEILAVNPRYESVAGYPCFPSLRDLPAVPDVAVFAIPAAGIPDGIAEAVEIGVPSAVVYASGFGVEGQGEGGITGEDSPRQRLAELCRGQISVLGPNCLGTINYARRTALFGIVMPFAHAGAEHGVGLVAQSGNMALTLASANRGVRFTHVVSCGNQLDVTAAELLGAYLQDPAVSVLAGLIEGVPDISRFAGVLEEAAERDVPVIVLKVGESERGQAATVAHTGTLSGSAALYRGLFRNYGVIQVDDLDELLAAAALMSAPRRARSAGVALFASSGGECGVVSDVADSVGVELPELPVEVASSLAGILPSYGRASNPLDITAGGWGNAELYARVVELLAAVEGVSTIVTVADSPTLERPEAGEGFSGIVGGMIEGARRVAAGGHVVALLDTIGDVARNVPPDASDGGVVPLVGLRAGMSALAKAGGRARWRARRASGDDGLAEVPAQAADSVAKLVHALGSGAVSEDAAKTIVGSYGVATPKRRLAVDPAEAVEAAEALGYPVVLKVAAAGILHKTEAGGVVLGLRDSGEVAVAAARLLGIPGAGADAKLLVEQQIAGGPEIIVGGRRDEVFGPVVMVGLGGVLTEMAADVAHRPAPVSVGSALDMLEELRYARVLDGYRGTPAIDRAELAQVVSVVSRLLADTPRLVEIDLNPLVVDATSGKIVALDALVALSD